MLFEMKSSAGRLTVTCDGSEIADGDKSFWSERAQMTIGGTRWEFGKDGGARTATPAGHPAPVMHAERRGLFSSTWDIVCPSGRYELKQPFFGREYRLSRGGVQVGVSGHDFWTWGIRPKLTVDSIPPEDGVFLLWIAFIMRRRQQAAANSGGGG